MANDKPKLSLENDCTQPTHQVKSGSLSKNCILRNRQQINRPFSQLVAKNRRIDRYVQLVYHIKCNEQFRKVVVDGNDIQKTLRHTKDSSSSMLCSLAYAMRQENFNN